MNSEMWGSVLQRFWSQGYAATTLTALASDCAMSDKQLRRRGGDKRELLLGALRHYLDQHSSACLDALEGGSRAAIEAFFKDWSKEAVAGAHHQGCFAVNCAVELGADEEVQRLVGRHLWRLMQAFEDAVQRALAAGEVAKTLNPAQAGAAMATIWYGVAVLARAQAPAAVLRLSAQSAVSVMDASQLPLDR